MKKKVVSLILILTLCVTFLSGCVLFERSNKNDYAQVVARIRNVEIVTEASSELFSKDITKRDLVIAYINNSQSQSAIQGSNAQESFDKILDQLIIRELVLARYQKMANNDEFGLTETEKAAQSAKDYNKAWKAVYDYCDQQIQSIESSLYSLKGLNAPQKGTAAGEPTYPLNTLVKKSEEDTQKDIDDAYAPKPFTPDPLNIPKAGDTYRLDAVKNFMVGMIQQFNEIKLTKEEEALLQADKDFISDNAKKPLIYEKIMGNGKLDNVPVSASPDSPGFFCIRKLIAQSQFDQAKYERMQEFYNKKIEVTDAQVQDYYDKTLESQQVNFSKTRAGYLDTYYNAVKDTANTPFVFYHPTSEVFYVKHILVPFSDAQKADIEAKGNGKTTAQKTEYRNGIAGQIKSYQHVNGYDDTSKGLFTMEEIYKDVVNSLSRSGGDTEWAFNDLIFKYNTDTGIFNNELGYIMPPKDKGISSGYMKEFELGAYELYNGGKGNPGDFLQRYAVTDYGVHLMYYSSNTGRFYENGRDGVVKLSDWTSPLKLQTYARAVKDYLLNLWQNQNFDSVQKQIAYEYTRDESGKYVKKYERRYADLVKSVQKAADAQAANNAQSAQNTQSTGMA